MSQRLDAPARITDNAATESRHDVDQQDVERIARQALKELGVATSAVTVTRGDKPDTYRVDFGGANVLLVRCGPGSTPQWVRSQVVDQYLAR